MLITSQCFSGRLRNFGLLILVFSCCSPVKPREHKSADVPADFMCLLSSNFIDPFIGVAIKHFHWIRQKRCSTAHGYETSYNLHHLHCQSLQRCNSRLSRQYPNVVTAIFSSSPFICDGTVTYFWWSWENVHFSLSLKTVRTQEWREF